jgi:hypothetical protein
MEKTPTLASSTTGPGCYAGLGGRVWCCASSQASIAECSRPGNPPSLGTTRPLVAENMYLKETGILQKFHNVEGLS